MEKNRTVPGERPVTPGQMKELVALLVQGIPSDMTFADAEYCIGNKGFIHAQERKLLFQGNTPENKALIDWQQTYVAATGCAFASFDDVRLGAKQEGFDRLVVIQRGMSLPQIEQLYTEADIKITFRDISRTDLDMARSRRYDENIGRISYAIWTEDIFRPDMVDMSADELAELHVSCMNLPEFLLLFWKYWQETGLPFDNGMFTMLPDTQFQDGTIPCAYWTGARVEVFKAPRDLKGPTYGARRICSF